MGGQVRRIQQISGSLSGLVSMGYAVDEIAAAVTRERPKGGAAMTSVDITEMVAGLAATNT